MKKCCEILSPEGDRAKDATPRDHGYLKWPLQFMPNSVIWHLLTSENVYKIRI